MRGVGGESAVLCAVVVGRVCDVRQKGEKQKNTTTNPHLSILKAFLMFHLRARRYRQSVASLAKRRKTGVPRSFGSARTARLSSPRSSRKRWCSGSVRPL